MNNADADLVFRGAHLESSYQPVDIVVCNGVIAAIEPCFSGLAAEEYDASGLMVTAPFIDPHQHLDCAFLCRPANRSGTLAEAIEINASVKHGRPSDDVYQKAYSALKLALLNGTGWIRSHVDVDTVSGLELLYPLLKARDKFRGLVDVQIVAFPQLGILDDPASLTLLEDAMRQGADIVGGIPHHEASMAAAARHIDLCFDVAQEFDADVDMHIDETDDPASQSLELLAEATIRYGYQGRVTAGHCCALAAYDDAYAHRVIERVAEAQINVITNPLVNLYLQGRHDREPRRRGITRVKELLAAGVNVACGMDDVRNVFFPFGRMDMLEVAMFTSVTAQLTAPEQIQTAFDMPRSRAARALRLPDYGLVVGKPADMVFLAAADAQEALQLQPPRRYVVRNGRVVAATTVQTSMELAN